MNSMEIRHLRSLKQILFKDLVTNNVYAVVSLCSVWEHPLADWRMAESWQAAEPNATLSEPIVMQVNAGEQEEPHGSPPQDRTTGVTAARLDSRRDSRAAASAKVMTTFPRYNVKPGSAFAVTRKQSLKREEGAFAGLFFRKLGTCLFAALSVVRWLGSRSLSSISSFLYINCIFVLC